MGNVRRLGIEVSALFMTLSGGVVGICLASLGDLPDTGPATMGRAVFALGFLMPLSVVGMFLGFAIWVLLLRSRVTLEEMLAITKNPQYPVIPRALEWIVRRMVRFGRTDDEPPDRAA
jgi:hypothetical protein